MPSPRNSKRPSECPGWEVRHTAGPPAGPPQTQHGWKAPGRALTFVGTPLQLDSQAQPPAVGERFQRQSPKNLTAVRRLPGNSWGISSGQQASTRRKHARERRSQPREGACSPQGSESREDRGGEEGAVREKCAVSDLGQMENTSTGPGHG